MVRGAVCVLALLAISALPALAQEQNKLDVSATYSLFRANPATPGFGSFTINGASASASYNINNWLSGAFDFGGYHNGNILNSGVGGTLYTYMLGPRFTYRRFSRFTPFGQVLLGGAHAGAGTFFTGSEHAFAWSVGGGVDAKINDRFSVRLGQLDYLMTRFGEFPNGSQAQTQNNFRFSTGLVMHF
jgi:outer membrane immunogenic protein